MSTAITEPLLTAEEFARLPDIGVPVELVWGKFVTLNVPEPRHGQICATIARLVGNAAEDHELGHVITNNAAVVTEREPDTVRGPDVAFYSFSRVPAGRLPPGYLSVLPELLFEVRSQADRWSWLLGKVSEYLEAGVTVVCVLDSLSETVSLFQQDERPQALHGDDEFHLPSILGDMHVRVQRFFE